MVGNITSLSRSGLGDWMLQRVSAIILGVYTVFLLAYLLAYPNLQYAQWSGLFDHLAMKVFTLLSLLSVVVHAWIGIWTITTDYLNDRALGRLSVIVRFPVQLFCFLALFYYIVWGIHIL